MQYNINASEEVNKLLMVASETAEKYNHGQIATEFLVYGILKLKNSKAQKLLYEYGITDAEFLDILKENNSTSTSTEPDLTPKSKQVFVMAQNMSREVGSQAVDVEHILFCILMNSDCVAVSILDKIFNANIIDLKNKLLEIIKQDVEKQKEQKNAENLQKNSKKLKNIGENSKIPAELQDLGIDLTEKARQGKIDNIIGRDKEITRLIEILCRKSKNNPCLVGEAGVGKSAVVEGLALKILANDVPNELKDKIIFSFDISGLMSGTKFRGALEQKLRDAINAVIKNQNIILFIDEIHTLVQTSSEKGEVSPVDILKPYLARGDIKTIGATTIDEYRKFIEKDKALERRFQPITINPPSKEETYQILNGIKQGYEMFHGVEISDDAIKSAIELSDRYIQGRNFPDKAIDLIDEACSRAKLIDSNKPSDVLDIEKEIAKLQKDKRQFVALENYEKAIEVRNKIAELKSEIERLYQFYGKDFEKKIVDGDDVANIVAMWTNIPVAKLTETEAQKLLNLENILHKRVVGQNDAIESVARAIRRSRAGLKTSKRPIGSFLFLGPTGVGKTELSKAVAEALFDDENSIIRLDMSEYMETNSVAKLIGSPPGYVGFEEGGQLTESVRRKPYSVVLLDEIEKASKDVLNLLLQVLDEGRLTDSHGKLVNFQNTIVIMTSNIGSYELEEMIDGETSSTKKTEIIQKYLKKYLRPELINRIDCISLFSSLDKESLAKIAKIMLTSLVQNLKEKNIQLKLTENALAYLITKGYNAEFGARPLRRIIEQEIESVISESIIRKEFGERAVITIDEDDGELVFDYTERY